ncbi:hypothetical protein Taro_001554, partial [Colocasia esculenta]|nr:hypothetical protein [Colocasia esculenta]
MAERYRLTRRRVRQILEQEEHMHSHGVNDPNPPIKVSEPHVGNATQVPSLSVEGNSLTSSHCDTSCSSKRTYGPTLKRDIYNMPPGQRLKVDFDWLNRAIVNYSENFAHFLGSIARNGQLLPIYIFDWRCIFEQNIQECLELVKSKFEFDVEKEKFVIAFISKKWKDHKERLKSRYFKVDGDNPCPLQYLESDQWENLVRNWKSEQGKKLSEVNKKNRAKQQLISTTGPKNIAKRQQDY